ncbi:MAG: hypothetical protein WCI18_14275 [Pseudomonadota bacterium]
MFFRLTEFKPFLGFLENTLKNQSTIMGSPTQDEFARRFIMIVESKPCAKPE